MSESKQPNKHTSAVPPGDCGDCPSALSPRQRTSRPTAPISPFWEPMLLAACCTPQYFLTAGGC